MIFHCQGSREPDPGTTVNTHIPVDCATFLQLILNPDGCGRFTAYCSPISNYSPRSPPGTIFQEQMFYGILICIYRVLSGIKPSVSTEIA